MKRFNPSEEWHKLTKGKNKKKGEDLIGGCQILGPCGNKEKWITALCDEENQDRDIEEVHSIGLIELLTD